MTGKQRIVAALLGLYPAAWRSEYGAELKDILLARPFTPRAIADVLWNGLWQRGRVAEPSTIMGLLSILVVLAGFVQGGSSGAADTASAQSTWKILPAASLPFLFAGVFALLHFICGCWTCLRRRKVRQAGLAAMRTALITGIPIVIGALLMMLGLAELRFPGATQLPPSPLAMMVAPLARLPDAFIWGVLGGLLGKQMTRRTGTTRP
jgi:hypothetical protein